MVRVKLATNGYITDDLMGGVYVYPNYNKSDMYKDLLHDLEDSLLEHVEVDVQIVITPKNKKNGQNK